MGFGIPAKLLRIHICQGDRYQGKPLYEAIVAKCREMQIAGATVLQALEGYGNAAEIHRHHVVGGDLPLLIQVVDTAENIERILPVVEAMMDKGLLAISDVEAVRIAKKPQV